MFPPGRGVRFVIGRNRDCDLCLSDLSVSRRHAQLVRREEGWILSDLGSHNGTRLNGWLVREPVRLSAGDRLEFGSMVFIIAADPPAGPAQPARAAEPAQPADPHWAAGPPWPDVTPRPEAAPDPMEALRAGVPGPDVPGPDVAPGPDVTLGPDDTPGAAGPIG
jgi:predicted component of type VI protein secretion system